MKRLGLQMVAPHARLPLRFFLAALVSLGACAAASAQEIYGWTDSNGVVTYSNLPPPAGVHVTDVIHDTPISPQAAREAAQRAEISALNDRIRLLELEEERNKRVVVDYADAPAAPFATGCSPDGYGYGYGNCGYQTGPYFTTGLLYGTVVRRPYDARGAGRNHGHPAHGPVRYAAPRSAQVAHFAGSASRGSPQHR